LAELWPLGTYGIFPTAELTKQNQVVLRRSASWHILETTGRLGNDPMAERGSSPTRSSDVRRPDVPPTPSSASFYQLKITRLQSPFGTPSFASVFIDFLFSVTSAAEPK
jgi:hypothetical protein